MPKDSHIQVTGVVTDVYKGGQFGIQLDNMPNGAAKITAKICGRMRKHRIRVIMGDKVDVSVSPYDMTHGIITFRHK